MPRCLPQPSPVTHKGFDVPSDPRDVTSLLNAIDRYQGTLGVSYAMKLGPLLIPRPGELRQAEWAEIDFAEAQWIIPAQKMKTRRPHLVPLSRQALGILEELQSFTGHSRYVFHSSRSPDECITKRAIDYGLRSIGSKMDSYVFQAMAKRILNEELGFTAEIIACQLARRADRQTELVWPRPEYLRERREMMQKLADYLDAVKGAAMVSPVKS